MKIFLRPQDEALEDTWKKAMTMLCYVVSILRDCCEFTDFRQTSFGSTYMTLLGFAQVMHVSNTFKKSREGMYFALSHKLSLPKRGKTSDISVSCRRDLKFRVSRMHFRAS